MYIMYVHIISIDIINLFLCLLLARAFVFLQILRCRLEYAQIQLVK